MAKTLATRTGDRNQLAGALLIGGLIGALTGAGAAYLVWQARGKRAPSGETGEALVTTGDAVKLGVIVFGLLRQINEIAHGK